MVTICRSYKLSQSLSSESLTRNWLSANSTRRWTAGRAARRRFSLPRGRCAGGMADWLGCAHRAVWSASWRFRMRSRMSRSGALSTSRWTHWPRSWTSGFARRHSRSALRHILRSHRSTLRRHWSLWRTSGKLTIGVDRRTWSRPAFRRSWFDGSRR